MSINQDDLVETLKSSVFAASATSSSMSTPSSCDFATHDLKFIRILLFHLVLFFLVSLAFGLDSFAVLTVLHLLLLIQSSLTVFVHELIIQLQLVFGEREDLSHLLSGHDLAPTNKVEPKPKDHLLFHSA